MQRVPASATSLVQLRKLGMIAPLLIRAADLAAEQGQSAQDLDELKKMLGFDPTTLQGLQQVGLDPGRELLLVTPAASGTAVWMIPVQDRAKLQKKVTELATRLWRADKIGEVTVGAGQGLKLSRSFGDREVPLGLLVFTPGNELALWSMGEGAQAGIKKILSTQSASSLAHNADFAADLKAVRDGPLRFWGQANVLAQNASTRKLAQNYKRLVGSAGLDDQGLWIAALARLSEQGAAQVSKTMAHRPQAPDMLKIARPHAALVLGGSVNMKALLDTLEASGDAERLKKMAAQSGVIADKAVLQDLSGGFGAAFYLDGLAELLPQLQKGGGGLAVLGQALRFELVAGVNPSSGNKLSAKLDQLMTSRGFGVSPQPQVGTGAKRAVIQSAQGEQSFFYAVQGNRLIASNHQGAGFRALLLAAGGSGEQGVLRGLSPGMKKLLQSAEPQAGYLYLSFRAAASALRQLSDSQTPALSRLSGSMEKISRQLDRMGALGMTFASQGRDVRVHVLLAPSTKDAVAP